MGRAASLRLLAIPAGPLLAIAAYLLVPHDVSREARATIAVASLMAFWWLSEALPLEATALVPLALFPICGIASIREAAAPYADQTIFLFMGGLFLSLAMERWNLHRRLAILALSIFGARPSRIILAILTCAAVLSMWTSNTATAAMMLPIASSIVAGIIGPDPAGRSARNFATGAMLAVAYGATIGGVGTLIGTPPNAFMASHLRSLGVELSFARWMLVGVPLAIATIPIAWIVITRVVLPIREGDLPDIGPTLRGQRDSLGRPSRGEWSVFAVFTLTALAWLLRIPLAEALGLFTTDADGKRSILLSDAGIAIGASLALFMLPVSLPRREFTLDWPTASRMPWGVLILFGGGLSLADAIARHGVDDLIASGFSGLSGTPTWLVIACLAAAVIFLTELVSNTAVAQTFIPIVGALAITLGIRPELLIVPVALAASFAFMLPMGTPPNALVFASGHVRIWPMARTGFVLNLVAILLITVATLILVPLAFSAPPSAGGPAPLP